MWRLRYEFPAMFFTFVCISYFALQIYVNLIMGPFLVSQEKKLTKFVYFLETMMYESSIFETNMMVCINLFVNLYPFDSRLCQGYFVSLKAKCELTIILDFLPQSCVLINNNNYCMAHWHIRTQSDDEQGINKQIDE